MSDETGPVNVTPAGAELAVTGALTVRVAVRNYMAVHHLWAAQRWTRLCDERESELVAAGENNPDLGHRSLAVAAVMSSVAFLEAFVNEVFADAVESEPGTHTYRTEGMSDAALGRMRHFWTGGAVPLDRSLTVLQKYQLGLVCVSETPFHKARSRTRVSTCS